MDVGELLNKAKNLSELELLLKKEGICFNKSDKLRNYLDNLWIEKIQKKLDVIIETPLIKIKKLPYSEITRDNVIYKIHGIPHGNSLNLPSSKFVNFICKEVQTYKQIEEHYLLEYGFSKIFNLEKSHEINYYPKLEKRLSEFKFTSFILNYCFEFIASFFLNKKLKKEKTEHYYYDNIIPLVIQALENPNLISKAREYYLTISLPEPFDLELNSHHNTGAVAVKISKIMTEELKLYAKTNNVNVLHYICGLAHESQISYFLENN